MSFKKPPLIPLIIALLGVGLLCALGSWQMLRFQERVTDFKHCDAKTTTLSKSYIAASQTLPDGCTLAITGQLQPQPVIAVGYHVQDSVMGTHAFGVLRADDGSQILVNMGWVQTPPPAFKRQSIMTQGKWITPHGSNSFTPDNSTLEHGIWYALDLETIVAHNALEKVVPKVLYAQTINPPVLQPFKPSTLRQTYLKPQTHLQYAGFWFTLALALSVIFILRFCRQ